MELKLLKILFCQLRNSEKGANGLVPKLLRRGHGPNGLVRWKWFRGEVERVEMSGFLRGPCPHHPGQIWVEDNDKTTRLV